ncbi:MAG: hypothetical protein KF754_16225 [Planctomycetes bacterium]|nr:hypothetical protein [Planctomycetota bacterium]
MRVLLLILFCCGPLCARTIDFVNLGVPEHRAARIQSQIEPAFEHVQAKTGLVDNREVFVTIVASGRRFAEIAAADGVSMNAESVLGYAVPSRRRLVLNFAAMDERNLEPLGVLRHEIAHLVMGELPVDRPLWFEEGLANYIEGIAYNALIEAAGAPPVGADIESLDDLSAALRDDRAGEAYPESRRVIELMVQTWGREKLTKLLHLLADGDADFAACFRQATGAELSELESRWLKQRREQSGGRLVAWLGANWSWLLFAGAGVLLVAGVTLRRRRARRQIDQWEEQEKYFPSDPAWSYTQPDEGYSPEDDEDDLQPR